MDLWVPDQAGREALGELPAAVRSRTFVAADPPPAGILDAEFLVPSSSATWLPELLGSMKQLRVIQTISAGVDWLLASKPAGVRLCSARGARDTAVAEWIVAAMLASAKSLPQLRDRQLQHSWRARETGDLTGSTVLILGYGSIGAALESRLEPFGVRLVRVARHARAGVHPAQELAQLLPHADVLVVLLPLTADTEQLLGSALLGLLPDGALLVNAARGSIVQTPALLELLNARRLRAALDVTDPEPLPSDHPLWDAPGTLITPHVAGDTPEAERRAFTLVGEQVRRYLAGEPLVNVVEHGY